MRLSKSIWQTLKEVPNDAEVVSHQLMVRAGLLSKAAAGIYNHMPIGLRVIKKVENIIREELDKIGNQEVLMSVVTPAELWVESGRWDVMDEMLKMKDKGQRDICLSPTNEESVTDIFRKFVKSYKQLPLTLYQINTKFRDEIRPRYGLMRCREFIMKDGYSFHLKKECLDKVYHEIYQAYVNIFKRLGLEFIVVEADAGAMADGGNMTHEFQVIANSGEDKVIYCPKTGYAANIEKAVTKRAQTKFNESKDLMTKVETPNAQSIEQVSEFLGIPQHHCLKALVYAAVKDDKESIIMALVLGDDEINEVKLKNVLKVSNLKLLSDQQIESLGLIKGFIGPINLPKEIKIIFDESVDHGASYVIGAMEKDKHTKNFIISRDLTEKFQVADLRLSKEGDHSIQGNCPVQLKKGIEVGHIFQLGDKYTKSMNVTVLDNNGKAVTPIMGCYGIGVTRLVAAAIEQNHDENGIIWPSSIAPYQIYLSYIAKEIEVKNLAEELYNEFVSHGFEVLFDDRNLGPGSMFKDSDLLGLPVRIVIGEREFKQTGLIELKFRNKPEVLKLKREELLPTIKKSLK